jgi:ketosteroid isomerase-like protein
MSQENVEVIERAYAAWNRAGLDAFLRYWAANAQWRSIQGAPDDRGPIDGRDAVRAFIEDWLDTLENFRVQPIELIDASEDQVVAVLRYSGRTRHSDLEVPAFFAAVFVVRQGQIVDGGEYETRREALEAAGLRR